MSQELAYLPLHLDLLHGMAGVYHGELEDMELTALDALKANDITKVSSWGTSSFHASKPIEVQQKQPPVPRLVHLPAVNCRRTELDLPTTSRCVHSSSNILLSVALGLGTAFWEHW